MPANLFLQGISIEELEALIRKVTEEVWNNYVELEGKTSLNKCHEKELSNTLLNRKETAALLGISLVTLHQWTNQGRLTAYRIGTRVRYKVDEVNNALTEIKPKYKRNG